MESLLNWKEMLEEMKNGDSKRVCDPSRCTLIPTMIWQISSDV
jgi:hypothetical protein